MISNSDRAKGFTAVEVTIVLVVLVILGAVGYLAYTNFIAPEPAATSSQTSTSSGPVKVENEEDLDTAIKALDDVPLDDSETAELESAANSF